MFNDLIVEYKTMIDAELVNIYNDGPKLLKKPINHIILGGKRLRPILCMLTAKSFNGNEKKSLICSVSIELLHIFSLVHDDIMDNDILRHGTKTIHSKWNIPIGILSGDAILALALIHLNRLTQNKNLIIEKFNAALIKVCEGQALDKEFETKSTVDISEYLNESLEPCNASSDSLIAGYGIDCPTALSSCANSFIEKTTAY